MLLAITSFSPRQFDRVHIVLASNEVGVFVVSISAPALGDWSAHDELRMEDLLQAQFDNEQNLLLFDGVATFSINMLIHQINKSEFCLDANESMLIGQSFTLDESE